MRLKAPDLTSTDRARADAPPALVVGWDEASAGRLPGDDAVAVEAGLAPDASWRSALRAAGVRVAPGETSAVTLPSGDGSSAVRCSWASTDPVRTGVGLRSGNWPSGPLGRCQTRGGG